MKRRRQIRAYALSLVALIVALLLRWLLGHWLGERNPYTTVFGAVAVAVWLGGHRVGILIAIIGYFACEVFFVGPKGQIGFHDVRDFAGFVAYAFSSATIIVFGYALHKANRRSEAATAKFESIFNQSGIFAGVLDPSGYLREVNKLALDACGYRREEVLNRLFWETPWWRNSGAVQERIRAATRQASEGKIFREILPYWCADGSERIADFAMLPICDESGAVRMLHPTGIDITEQKKAEEALRQSERKHRIVADNTYDFEFWRDPNGRFIYVSPSYERITGSAPTALLENSELLLQLIHPDDRGYFDARVRSGAHAGVEFEYRIVRPDGETRWVAQVSQPVRDEYGNYLGVRGSVRDVTERRQMREALREAKESAETANAAKDRFIAALSHELRTPLTPVLLAAQLHENSAQVPQELRADFAMIRENIQLETHLIDDLLDCARITQGKLRYHRVPCDMHSTIEKAAETVLPEIRGRQIIFEKKFKATNSIVDGDCFRLQQVIWNLIRNAAKFSESGGHIVVETADGVDKLHITVADQGIGIAPADLTRIFREFEQLSAASRHQVGLGLGLSISKFIVEAHGGSIWAESAGEGHGSKFHVELPVAPTQQRAGIEKPDLEKNHVTEPALHILLIEDDDASRTILSRLLTHRGHDVVQVENSSRAREAASAQKFDLVISDLGLPDGDGYTIMRELRDAYQLTGIALSGYGMDDDFRRSREAGFAQHLVKPVSIDALISALRMVSAARNCTASINQ